MRTTQTNHADKTGGTDSSPLFAAIRTAYETLATSRDRALYKAVPGPAPAPGGGDGGSEFRWAVEVGAPSTRECTGGGVSVPGTSSSRGRARPAKGERPRPRVPAKETNSSGGGSRSSSEPLVGQGSSFCRGKHASAGLREGLGGASRRGRHGARGRDTQGTRGEPGSDDSKGRQRKEKLHAHDSAGGGTERRERDLDVEGQAGLAAEIDAGITPSAAPRQAKGRDKQQQPDRHARGGETQRGNAEKEDEPVGSEFGHQVSIGADWLVQAPRPSDSHSAPFFAGAGGAHPPIAPLEGQQQPRKPPPPGDRSVEEDGDVARPHRLPRTPAPPRAGSPLPLRSQPAATQTASFGRASTRPLAENIVTSGSEAAGEPSAVASSPAGSSGERSQSEGEPTAGSCSSHGPFRDQLVETSATGSSLSDDTSSSGFGGGGGGGGCVQRLRERVTARGGGQYHNATACSSPVSGVSPDKVVGVVQRLAFCRLCVGAIEHRYLCVQGLIMKLLFEVHNMCLVRTLWVLSNNPPNRQYRPQVG